MAFGRNFLKAICCGDKNAVKTNLRKEMYHIINY